MTVLLEGDKHTVNNGSYDFLYEAGVFSWLWDLECPQGRLGMPIF